MLDKNKTEEQNESTELCIPVDTAFREAFVALLPQIYTVHAWNEKKGNYAHPKVTVCCKTSKSRNKDLAHKAKTFNFKLLDFNSEEKINEFLFNTLPKTCDLCELPKSELESDINMEEVNESKSGSESESESEPKPKPKPLIKKKR